MIPYAVSRLAILMRVKPSLAGCNGHQRRACSHQPGPRPNNREIGLRLRCDGSPATAAADRCAPAGQESAHPADHLCADQTHVVRMGHDGLLSQPTQKPAHPRRMHPGLQRDATARHGRKPGHERLGSGSNLFFLDDAPGFVEHAVEARPVAQIQADGEGCVCSFSIAGSARVLSFFMAGLLYLLCLRARR